MEKIWNHQRIRLLLSADPEALEQFLQTYSPVIYTWMYYKVGADPKIAMDLTIHTLSEALREISKFNPAKEIFSMWLKERAKNCLEEGLERWQIKPQRPWAWSQLPDDIVCGLARFRVELLDDKIISSPFVHEIVQASLSELDQRDRELLMRRFGHLESEEQMAEEMDCSIEDLQNWVYRSRHAFRRIFIQLISSSNNGFSESNNTGEIEIQDTNLEKLLSTMADNLSLEDSQAQIIRNQLLQTAEEISQTLPEERLNPRILIVAGAVILTIVILGLIFWLSNNTSVEPPTSVPVASEEPQEAIEPETSKTQMQQPAQDDIDGQELKVIFALGQAGDVEALLEVLKSGQFTSQVAAAHFLGKLADPNAIDLLEQAESQWYPEPTDDNAFAKAVAEILARFPEAVQIVDTPKEDAQEIETAQQSDTKDQTQETPATILNLTGIVTDFMNQPVANAVIDVTKNVLFSKTDKNIKLASANTNPEGQFQFTDMDQGAASVVGRVNLDNPITITRSVWCQKDSICIVNIGGKPALTGTVTIDNELLARQTLYLSDTIDIDNASFLEETRTGTNGNFTFLGIAPNTYSLFYMGLDNRMHRLGLFQKTPYEVSNLNMDLTSATVLVDYTTEPNQPLPTKAVLSYMMGISDAFYQPQAQTSDNGSLFFENVLPGSYVLKVLLDSGVWIQQEIEVANGAQEQIVIVDPVSSQPSVLSGQLLNASPVNLFLTNMNQQIHVDIEPNADGSYKLQSVPSDVYSLSTFVNGQLIEFLQIDLQEEPEMMLDIDPDEILSSYSPLYVVVADPSGLIVSGAQVWLTNGQQVDTTSSTGQGAFLATNPGSYTLSVALPGYPTIEKQVELKSSTLLAAPNPDNTVLIQLSIQSQ